MSRSYPPAVTCLPSLGEPCNGPCHRCAPTEEPTVADDRATEIAQDVGALPPYTVTYIDPKGVRHEETTESARLTDAEYEVMAEAFVSANRAEYEPLDHDVPIEGAVAQLLGNARAEAWDDAMEAVRVRIFNSYSHGHERGEAWVPFMADLIRSLRDQPIPNPHNPPVLPGGDQ